MSVDILSYSKTTDMKTVVVDVNSSLEHFHQTLYELLGLVPSDGIHKICKLDADTYDRFYKYLVKVSNTFNRSGTKKIWPMALCNVLACETIECLDQEAFDVLFQFGYYESLLERLKQDLDDFSPWSDWCIDPNFNRENLNKKIDACKKAIESGLLNPNNRI